MAKKVIAKLKEGKGKAFAKAIKMVKCPETESYKFVEEIVNKEHIQDFFKK